MTPLCEYIQQLSNTMGVSGYEDQVLQAIASILSSHSVPFTYDSFGNLLVQLGDDHAEEKPLICAHSDEVGIQVQKVEHPFVWFRTFGSLDRSGGAAQHRII
jgi:putative aminopeptidase FrvX